MLWQLNHRHGQAFYVHTKKTVQSKIHKRGEFPLKNAVVYNTVHGPAAFVGALAMKICKSKFTASTCLPVRPSISLYLKKQWYTGIYNTWYWTFNKICPHIPTLFATRHNNRPDALHENPHTLRKYAGRNSSYIYIYIEAKICTRTKVQCVHYVQHIFFPGLIVLDIIKQKSVDKQELWYCVFISQIIKPNSSIWNYLSSNLYTFEFLTVHFKFNTAICSSPTFPFALLKLQVNPFHQYRFRKTLIIQKFM